jgi:hypothetical protein
MIAAFTSAVSLLGLPFLRPAPERLPPELARLPLVAVCGFGGGRAVASAVLDAEGREERLLLDAVG